jgi:AcrR family transcriptional regulator
VHLQTRRPGRPSGGQLAIDIDGVLDAAERVIRRDGFAASVDAIALEAGLTKPSLYARVGDRASLSDRLAVRLAERLVDTAGAELAAGLGRDALAACFRRTFEELRQHRELFLFVTRGSSADAAARTLHLAERSAEPLADLLADWRRRQGRDLSVARPWAYGLVGMLNMVALWWLHDGDGDARRIADGLADLAWHGLDGPAPTGDREGPR